MKPDRPATELNELLLKNQTVLVTRSKSQSYSLARSLESLGAQVAFHPTIEILQLADFSELDAGISELTKYRSIVFVSSNGVTHFASRLTERFEPNAAVLSSAYLFGIGNATVDQIKQSFGEKSFGENLEVTSPPAANSESLAELLIENPQEPILLIRANRGSNVLSERLSAANIRFDEIAAYQSRDVEKADPTIEARIAAGEIDWITLTSSAIATAALKIFDRAIKAGKQANSKSCKLVSISPTTSQAIGNCGFKPDAEATTYNMAGIIEAMKAHPG